MFNKIDQNQYAAKRDTYN